MTNHRRFNLYNIVLYLLGFILIWEWLRPLEVVTDTANSVYFVIFTAICFILYFLRVPFLLSMPLRFILLLYILHDLFFEGSFLGISWLYSFYEDIVINTEALFHSQWFEMSDLYRSFLFLILLWVMSYLIHYWLIHAKRIFGFYLLTIIYLGILDTFTKYDAGNAIVRTIIIGFIMLGTLQMLRLREKEEVKIRSYWLASLSLMVALAIVIGLHAPKAGPQWPDPVPFLKSAVKGEFIGNSVNKIGYGVDDSKLGGAFIDDDTAVFTAEVKKAHYWRVESKDYYTGKGWIITESYPKTFIDKNNIDLGIFENVTKEENISEKIKVKDIGDYPHIAYPLDLRAIKTDQNVQLLMERFSGKLFTEKNGDEIQLDSYEFIYDHPLFSIEALKLANGGDDAYIKTFYTQLPEELPTRVKDLAKVITENKATRYEKAKAIESYFAANGFTYETKNVAVPDEDQDYVDQFLFESKKGYCDNFSTSMIVLLRSLDIPARWVKGYTQGDFIKVLDDDAKLYEVKNSNAHSWVEVYFPGIGWVPFEPTQGFSNMNEFTENTVPTASQVDQAEDPQNEQKKKEEEKKKESKDNKRNSSFSLNDLNIPLKEIGIFAAVAALLVGLLVKFKTKWYPYWIVMKYRIRKKKLEEREVLDTLFLLLENKGMKIQGGETLREYAAKVDEHLGTSEMKKLAEIYEKYLYSNFDIKTEDWDVILELWGKLIKKILP